jgi:hypothetical protein
MYGWCSPVCSGSESGILDGSRFSCTPTKLSHCIQPLRKWSTLKLTYEGEPHHNKRSRLAVVLSAIIPGARQSHNNHTHLASCGSSSRRDLELDAKGIFCKNSE